VFLAKDLPMLQLAPRHYAANVLLLILALAVGAYALGYHWIYSNSDDGFIVKFRTLNPVLVYAHFIGGGLALCLGAIQLWIKRPSRLHFWLGRTYCLCVLVGAVGGGYLSFYSHLGAITGLGFFIVDVLWICTTFIALRFAMSRQFNAHRRWILRSFALSCAAISLRVLLPLLSLFFSFETSYALVAWLSWSINLVIVEFYLYYTRNRTKALTIGSLTS
jgi:uncharacterized membrane protein